MEPLDPDLRRLVDRAMVQAVPDRATSDRVLARIVAQVGPAAPDLELELELDASVPVPEAATAGSAITGTGKIVALIVAIGGGAIGAAALSAGARSSPTIAVAPAAETIHDEPATVSIPADPIEDEPAPVDGVEPLPLDEPELERRSSRAGMRRTKTDPTPSADVLQAELGLIRAGHRALEQAQPARALELAAAHAREHPTGQLALEREAIDAIARCQLGDVTAAERFTARNSETTLAHKVRTQCKMTDRRAPRD